MLAPRIKRLLIASLKWRLDYISKHTIRNTILLYLSLNFILGKVKLRLNLILSKNYTVNKLAKQINFQATKTDKKRIRKYILEYEKNKQA